MYLSHLLSRDDTVLALFKHGAALFPTLSFYSTIYPSPPPANLVLPLHANASHLLLTLLSPTQSFPLAALLTAVSRSPSSSPVVSPPFVFNPKALESLPTATRSLTRSLTHSSHRLASSHSASTSSLLPRSFNPRSFAASHPAYSPCIFLPPFLPSLVPAFLPSSPVFCQLSHH